MRWRITAVVAGTALALVASSLYVPIAIGEPVVERGEYAAWMHDTDSTRSWYCWIWDRPEELQAGTTNTWVRFPVRIRWDQLAAVQAVVLMTGGGLLTWAIRRKRRSAAARAP